MLMPYKEPTANIRVRANVRELLKKHKEEQGGSWEEFLLGITVQEAMANEQG